MFELNEHDVHLIHFQLRFGWLHFSQECGTEVLHAWEATNACEYHNIEIDISLHPATNFIADGTRPRIYDTYIISRHCRPNAVVEAGLHCQPTKIENRTCELQFRCKRHKTTPIPVYKNRIHRAPATFLLFDSFIVSCHPRRTNFSTQHHIKLAS